MDENIPDEVNTSLCNSNHEELVHMLASLQAGVEARDIIIAALQCEQSHFLIDDAKRHRYFLNKSFEIDLDDPILALQKDAIFFSSSNDSLNSRGVKTNPDGSHEPQVISFKELITAQRHAHAFYREQLHSAGERYGALCSHFEEERARLERDAAQCDDVVAMLEKEREKLQVELDSERNQNKRLKMELKKAIDNLNSQKDLSQRQRMVAAQLIKEKRRLQKDLLTQCERLQQLESNLEISSPLSPDVPSSSSNAVSASATVKTTSVAVPRFHVGGGGESLRCKKSLSPPSACRESANAPPPPSSPLVPFCTSTTKPDNDVCLGILTSNRVNGCSPPSSPASFSDSSASDASKAKSPPPVKTRPEPPVRRTPEVNSPTALTSIKLETLEVEAIGNKSTAVISVTTCLEAEKGEDEKHSASPSPPPPPPQMQLHYPYPGMQGNPHHPPVRPARSAFSGSHLGIPSVSTASHFSGTRVPPRSPALPITTSSSSHQFPYAQPQRATPSSMLFTGVCSSGFRKISPIFSQQTRSSTAATPHGGLIKSAVAPVPRVIVASRGARSPANAGPGNVYINGK